MQEWLKISLQLSVYGFFYGCTPVTHFLFQFLTEFRGISAENVSDFYLQQLTYWNLALLLVFFLITDMFRYKPLIILSALASICHYATMQWTHGLNTLILSAFLYGLQTATEIAYFTYIYAKVDKGHYQQVTSNARSAMLFGRCTGAVMSQLFMMYKVVSVNKLNYISFGSKCIAFLVALTLPAAKTSIYFYHKKTNQPIPEFESQKDDTVAALECQSTDNITRRPSMDMKLQDNNGIEEEPVQFSWRNAKSLLLSHIRSGYSNQTVLLWSLWWALMQTGFRMVYTYNQPLWYFIEPDREDIYNGFAETGLTLFGALGALLAGKLNQQFVEKWAIWIMVVCSIGQGTLSIVAGNTTNVFVSYAVYIALGAVYYFMVTVCSAIVAKHLVQDSFGLIFGINTWVALFFTFIFTFVVVSGTFFTLNPAEQYTIYGCYFYALAIIYLCYAVYKVVKRNTRRRED